MRKYIVSAISCKELIAPIALKYHLDVSAQLFTQQIQRNIGRIGKWIVVGTNQPGHNIFHAAAGDLDFVMFRPIIVRHKSSGGQLVYPSSEIESD